MGNTTDNLRPVSIRYLIEGEIIRQVYRISCQKGAIGQYCRLLIIRALCAAVGYLSSLPGSKRVPQLSNYQLITRYAVSLQLALGWNLALCFPQSLLAQQDSIARTSTNSIVKALGPIDYVEINTLSASSQPKQLIIFVYGIPGSYMAFRSYLSDPTMQEKFHMISVTRSGWRNDEGAKAPSIDDQAAALRTLLDMDRSGKRALLMGHSYGGPVIARTATNYSELIAGLIFVATTSDPELSVPRW